MKGIEKTIEFNYRGKRIICDATSIPKKKLVSFIFKYANRTIKNITLPTIAQKIASKMIRELDAISAKEIFKIDIIC